MARMPDLAARALCLLAGYVVGTVVTYGIARQHLRAFAAQAEQRAAMKASKERIAASKQADALRRWRAQWTPERWGMPEGAVRSLEAIVSDGARPSGGSD